MRINELLEQTAISGSSLAPAVGSTISPAPSGNVSAITDPKFAAAQAINIKQQKVKQRQMLQKQLADLQRQSQEQLKSLQQQIADLNKP